METYTDIISLLVWLAFCFASGIIEAYFFHVADYSKLNHANTVYGDVHGYLNILRIIVAVGVLPVSMYIPSVCVFPYIHDGAYYSFRNVMDRNVYPERWKTERSMDTTAMISLKFKSRVTLFGAGLAIALTIFFSSNF
jgi:hypothetical protein